MTTLVGQPSLADSSVSIFNGLDATTGRYLVAPTAAALADLALVDRIDPDHLESALQRVHSNQPTMGVVDGVDASDLAQAGWGVVFPSDVDPNIERALEQLLALREEKAKSDSETRFRVYCGDDGYHAGEGKKDFLRRRGAPGFGPVNPDQMPYYLLLVGGPDKIPYSLQRQLAIQYAVGRIDFDSPLEYERYARSVVTAERANPRPRHTVLFGVQNPSDPATSLSASYLVAPLGQHLDQWLRQPPNLSINADVRTVIGSHATKDRLAQILGGPDTPALCFTASHGIGFPNGHRLQRQYQGALVCQDWPGSDAWRPDARYDVLPSEYFFSAEDIGEDAELLGLIAFFFACYGAGTPSSSDYPQIDQSRAGLGLNRLGMALSQAIAPAAFTARLPQRLLGHPNGGALAVIGHVERALGSSFVWQSLGVQRASIDTFEGTLRRLLRGERVGAALEYFHERYAELSSALSEIVREVGQFGKVVQPSEIAGLWTANSDAGGYVILGDPAVRLVPANVTSPIEQTGTPSVTGPASYPTDRAASATDATPAQSPSTAITTTGQVPMRVEVDAQLGRISVTILPAQPTEGNSAGEAASYSVGLGSSGKQSLDALRTRLASLFSDFAEQIGTALKNLANEVAQVEVATYVSEHLEDVRYDKAGHAFSGPVERRVITAMRLDGGTLLALPREASAFDERVWTAHMATLEMAQNHRIEMIKAAASAASSLAGILKS